MCPSDVREEPVNGLSLECGAERIGVWNLLGKTAKPPQSVTKNSPNDRFRIASHWEPFVARTSGAEVLSIQRTRRKEILLVLKKGDDVSAFEKALDKTVGEKANVKSLVSKRTLEVRDLDETVTREGWVGELPHPRA